MSSSKHDSIPATLCELRYATIWRTVSLFRSSASVSAAVSALTFVAAIDRYPQYDSPRSVCRAARAGYPGWRVNGEDEKRMGRTVAVVAGGTLLFAAVHSVLATNWMKQTVEAIVGRRARDGHYRFAYNQITYSSIWIMFLAFKGLPDRVVYRVPRPWSLLMRLG